MASALPQNPHTPALVCAAALLGAALQVDNGFYSTWAIRLMVGAVVLMWAALVAPRVLGRLVADRPETTAALLFLVVQGQLVVLIVSPIGMYFAQPLPADHPGFVPALMVAAIASGCALVAGPRGRRGAAAALLACALLLGVLTYRGSPRPHIDVVTVHEAAYTALTTGESPYSMSFPDIYGGRQDFYPDGVVRDGRVHYGFPYPPLSLLMTWPALAYGDLRYSELAAWVTAALAVVAIGRASAVAVLAGALMLTTPRAYFGLEQAWTDPLAAMWLCAAVWAFARRQLTLAAVLVGLAAATKQYAVLAVPLLALTATTDWRMARRLVVISSLAAAVTLLPALFDAPGAWASIVMVQVREELRMDALSLAVPYAAATGHALPGLAYAALVLGATAIAGWRAPRTPAGFATAVAVTLATTFLFGKKAFCNYYLFTLVVTCAAIAASRDDTAPPLRPA